MMTIVTAMMLLVMIRLTTISMPILMGVKNKKKQKDLKKVPKPPGQVSLSALSLPVCGQELKRFPAVRSSHQHDNHDNHNQNKYHHNCHHGPT